jgi:predicted nucleic acid binding AN1-type Zn finger protein
MTPAEQPAKKPKQSCSASECKKKVGLLGFTCNACSLVHCAAHRLAEDHRCARIDVFRDTAAIKASNPKIVPSKIVKL